MSRSISLPGWMRRTGRGLGTVSLVMTLLATSAEAMATNLSDLSYGPDQRQVLDLLLPPDAKGPMPILVYFHGGGFVGGDKHPCVPRLVTRLFERNMAMACVNYRLSPAVTYPVPMLDGARAIQWLRVHAAEYGLDASRIAVFGISAGGGIALWVGFHGDLADPGNADPVLRQSSRVSAVVTSNAQATYDPATIAAELRTQRYPKFLADLFGADSVRDLTAERFKAAERDASPITHLHGGGPPILAYYTSDAGEDLAPDSDPEAYIHHPAQGALLRRTAEQRGVALTLHTGGFYAKGWPGFLDDVARFLDSAL